jgi:hypothetical protein
MIMWFKELIGFLFCFDHQTCDIGDYYVSAEGTSGTISDIPWIMNLIIGPIIILSTYWEELRREKCKKTRNLTPSTSKPPFKFVAATYPPACIYRLSNPTFIWNSFTAKPFEIEIVLCGVAHFINELVEPRECDTGYYSTVIKTKEVGK